MTNGSGFGHALPCDELDHQGRQSARDIGEWAYRKTEGDVLAGIVAASLPVGLALLWGVAKVAARCP